MSKPLDYYAGYPNQQRTPKWVGVTLGSLFGGLIIAMLVVGIRLAMPPRSAEASIAPKPEPSAPVVAPSEPAAAAAPAEEASLEPVAGHHHRGHKAKTGKPGKIAGYTKVKSTPNPRYQKAQVFGKSVSSSRRDKKARDELDKMLGL